MGEKQTFVGSQQSTHTRPNGPPYAADASSDQIKSDIESTRSEMDETIDELGERLHPRHLLDDFVGMFEGSGSDARRSAKRVGRMVAREVKENPVPAMLIGAGLAWLIVDRNGRSADIFRPRLRAEYGPYTGYYPGEYGPERAPVYDYYADASYPGAGDLDDEANAETQYGGTQEPGIGEKARSKAKEAKHKASDAADAVREKASDVAESAKESAASAGHAMRSAAERARNAAERGAHRVSHAGAVGRRRAVRAGRVARSRAEHWGEEIAHEAQAGWQCTRDAFIDAKDRHPLALGAGFLAMGVLAGLAIPQTRRENRWMGHASDEFKSEALERGVDLADRGLEAAEAGRMAAMQEAEARGLTPHQLKEKAEHIGEDLKDAAKESARDEGLTKDRLKEGASAVVQRAKEAAKNEAKEHKTDSTPSTYPSQSEQPPA